MKFIYILVFSTLSAQKIPVQFDHIIIVTPNLNRSISNWKNNGFTVKERKPHQNGIQNAIIEFENNTEIELLSVSNPTDELARMYRNRINEIKNETPMFVAFKIDHYEHLISLHDSLLQNKFAPILKLGKGFNILSFPEDSEYSSLFFIHYIVKNNNKSPWTVHKNGVQKIKEIELPINPNSELFNFIQLSKSSGIKFTNSHQNQIIGPKF